MNGTRRWSVVLCFLSSFIGRRAEGEGELCFSRGGLEHRALLQEQGRAAGGRVCLQAVGGSRRVPLSS